MITAGGAREAMPSSPVPRSADSLAGFAQDATLPSDPRVIYIGDDIKSRHAQVIQAANIRVE